MHIYKMNFTTKSCYKIVKPYHYDTEKYQQEGISLNWYQKRFSRVLILALMLISLKESKYKISLKKWKDSNNLLHFLEITNVIKAIITLSLNLV